MKRVLGAIFCLAMLASAAPILSESLPTFEEIMAAARLNAEAPQAESETPLVISMEDLEKIVGAQNLCAAYCCTGPGCPSCRTLCGGEPAGCVSNCCVSF